MSDGGALLLFGDLPPEFRHRVRQLARDVGAECIVTEPWHDASRFRSSEGALAFQLKDWMDSRKASAIDRRSVLVIGTDGRTDDKGLSRVVGHVSDFHDVCLVHFGRSPWWTQFDVWSTDVRRFHIRPSGDARPVEEYLRLGLERIRVEREPLLVEPIGPVAEPLDRMPISWRSDSGANRPKIDHSEVGTMTSTSTEPKTESAPDGNDHTDDDGDPSVVANVEEEWSEVTPRRRWSPFGKRTADASAPVLRPESEPSRNFEAPNHTAEEVRSDTEIELSEPRTPSEPPLSSRLVELERELERLQMELGELRRNHVVEAQRSPNGPPTVEAPSRLNSAPWYATGWAKLHAKKGPARDFECEFGQVGDLLVVGGTVRGWKHRFRGEENQDAFYLDASKDILIAVVCDGVSNAAYSAFTARYLAEKTATKLAEFDRKSDETHGEFEVRVRRVIAEVSADLLAWDERGLSAPPLRGVELSEENRLEMLASTWCVAEIPLQSGEDGRRVVRIASVGDSPCYTLDGDRWSVRSDVLKDGVIVENATSALPTRTSDSVAISTAEFEVGAKEIILLATDGIGTSLVNGNTPVGRWLAPRVGSLIGPMVESRLHDILAFDRQGEDDDRTLIAVYDKGIVERVSRDG